MSQTLVWKGPGQLRFETRSVPTASPGWVVLRVEAAGVCGSDVAAYRENSGRREPGIVMGHEAVGTVVESGHGAWKQGDAAVFTPIVACGSCGYCASGSENRCETRNLIGGQLPYDGAFADHVAVPAANLVRWESTKDIQLGALIEPLAVGFHAWELASTRQTRPSATIIVGAGMIGLGAAIIGHLLSDTKLYLVDPDASRSSHASLVGAMAVTGDADEVEKQLTDHIPEGADVVIDAVGTEASIATSISNVATGGTVVLIGTARSRATIDTSKLVTRECILRGSYAYSRRSFELTYDLVNKHLGLLRQIPFTLESLNDGADVIDDLAHGRRRDLKILLQPGSSS